MKRLRSICITITSRSNALRITTKGQVTIPQEIRIRLGLLPHTKVTFELADDHARIRKAEAEPGQSTRGRMAVEALWGTANTKMTTDEIMALTRGSIARRKRRK
jgi:AbrB family looped-hinge helix DNA binding protein